MKNLKKVLHIFLTCLILALALSPLAIAKDINYRGIRGGGAVSEAITAYRNGNQVKGYEITLEAQNNHIQDIQPGMTLKTLLQQVKNNPNMAGKNGLRQISDFSWRLGLSVSIAKNKKPVAEYFKNKSAINHFKQALLLNPNNASASRDLAKLQQKSAFSGME